MPIIVKVFVIKTVILTEFSMIHVRLELGEFIDMLSVELWIRNLISLLVL